MNYKILDPSEWSKLENIIPAEYLPRPEVAAAAVAEHEEDSQIVGVLFMQLALRLEPLVIQDSHVNFKRLHALLESAIANQKGLRYWCHTANDRVAAMAETVGMELVKEKVYVKEIR